MLVVGGRKRPYEQAPNKYGLAFIQCRFAFCVRDGPAINSREIGKGLRGGSQEEGKGGEFHKATRCGWERQLLMAFMPSKVEMGATERKDIIANFETGIIVR